MTTDSKNLIEEIIDNAINPSEHDDADATTPDTIHPDSIKRPLNDPLNKNLVPDPDKP
jgi:hypothetical protein